MFILLVTDFPVAAAVDGVAVGLEPFTHGVQALHLGGGDGAVCLGADVNKEVAIAADNLDHLVNDLFDTLILVTFQIAKGRAEGGAALPFGTNDFHLEIVFLQAANAIRPVALATLVVHINRLATCRPMIHEPGDHAA